LSPFTKCSSSTYAHRHFIYLCDEAHSAVCRGQREWESQERKGWTLLSLDSFRGCQWVHPEVQSLIERSVSSCIWLAYDFRSNRICQSDLIRYKNSLSAQWAVALLDTPNVFSAQIQKGRNTPSISFAKLLICYTISMVHLTLSFKAFEWSIRRKNFFNWSIKECFQAFVRSRLHSDIHCQYWKSIAYIICTIVFQYWQWISERIPRRS